MNDPDYHARHSAAAAAREAEKVRKQLEVERKTRKRVSNRAEELERDVRFLTLMNRALLEVVLDAELIEVEHFAELMVELDKGLDGTAGDGLSTQTVADELGLARSELDKTEQWVRANKKKKAGGGVRRNLKRIRRRFE